MLPLVVKVILIYLYASLVCLCCSEASTKNSSIPALLAFGDSFADSGNNNYRETIAKANFLPYGKDFLGGKPTGRFSNGKTLADTVAAKLGVKDYLPAYLDPSLQDKDILTGCSFASAVSGYDPLTAKLFEMHKLGARKMVFFNSPILGCFPLARTIAGGVHRKCGRIFIKEAQTFNSMLNGRIQFLGKSLPKSRFTIIDYFKILQHIIEYADQYGLEVVDRGCCGTGTIEVSVLCNKFSPVCPDDTKYFYWDSLHLTEKGYSIVVDHALQDLKNIML